MKAHLHVCHEDWGQFHGHMDTSPGMQLWRNTQIFHHSRASTIRELNQ